MTIGLGPNLARNSVCIILTYRTVSALSMGEFVRYNNSRSATNIPFRLMGRSNPAGQAFCVVQSASDFFYFFLFSNVTTAMHYYIPITHTRYVYNNNLWTPRSTTVIRSVRSKTWEFSFFFLIREKKSSLIRIKNVFRFIKIYKTDSLLFGVVRGHSINGAGGGRVCVRDVRIVSIRYTRTGSFSLVLPGREKKS